MLQVHSVFRSIQGEGVLAGIPTTFVRLHGCNLRCSYCDTPGAQMVRCETDALTSIADVFERVNECYDTIECVAFAPFISWVCITGGEPLMQQESLAQLVRLLRTRYRVTIETNGTIEPPSWWTLVDSWVVDCKCPSSGVHDRFDFRWLEVIRSMNHQLKFVVTSLTDFSFVTQFMKDNKVFCPNVLVSPGIIEGMHSDRDRSVWTTAWRQSVADYCVRKGLRFSLQIHKVVWGNKEGV